MRVVVMIVGMLVTAALAPVTGASDALSFGAPSGWAVGDDWSTYQEWDVFSAGAGNLPDVGQVAEPALATDPVCAVLPPGFFSSSANFYAFGGDYSVAVTVRNHGAAAPAGYGTLVRVQTAATLNSDFPHSLVLDGIRLETLGGDPLPGGANADVCRLEERYRGPAVIGGPFGDVEQDEWLIEFWLPAWTDDFRVMIDCRVHASFLAVRVDTLCAATPLCEPADLNADCRVDGADVDVLLAALAGPTKPPACDAGAPACGAADWDGDEDVDLADVAAFQAAFSK